MIFRLIRKISFNFNEKSSCIFWLDDISWIHEESENPDRKLKFQLMQEKNSLWNFSTDSLDFPQWNYLRESQAASIHVESCL